MNIADSLHAEIQFWEEMLCQQNKDTAPEILDRMQMAKLLAEKKLSLYSIEFCEIAH